MPVRTLRRRTAKGTETLFISTFKSLRPLVVRPIPILSCIPPRTHLASHHNKRQIKISVAPKSAIAKDTKRLQENKELYGNDDNIDIVELN